MTSEPQLSNPQQPATKGKGWTLATAVMLVFLALLPVGLLSIYAFKVISGSVREMVQANNALAATEAAELLGHQFQQSQQLAASFASLPGMREAVQRHDVEGVHERLRPLVDAFPEIERAGVLDRLGMLWTDYPPKQNYGRIYPLPQDLAIANRRSVSSVFQSLDGAKDMVVAVATPVTDDQNQLAGILVYELRLEGITDWLKRANHGSAYAFVLDQSGTVAAHPYLALQARRYAEYARLDPVRRALAGETTAVEYNDPLSKRRMVAAFVPVTVGAGRWVVVAQQPADDAYAPIHRLRVQIAIGAAILGLAALATAGLISRSSTRIRRLGRALAERNSRLDVERTQLRTLIDHLPDHIFIKDAGGRYVIDNLAHTRFVGAATPDEVVGKTVYDFFPGEMAARYTEDDQQVMQSGTPLVNREEPITDDHGAVRWVSTTKVPVQDGDNKVVGLVCISSDVTARKQAEQERAALLEREQAARGEAEAAVKALKHAQSQMVQAEKLSSLGMLVAGVAHEINNPLSFVTNNLAVLQRDSNELCKLLKLYTVADPMLAAQDPKTSEEIREAAERMDLAYVLENVPDLLNRSREGLRRIQQIVKDLREFSRQEVVGDMQEGSDLNAGVQSTLNIVRGRANRKGVTLVEALGAVPGITSHPAKLNQVILNLVANAIDACDRNGTVTVRTKAVPGGVQLQVADTGSGIPPEIQERIFDPFFTTKPLGQGTGLGLSISHGIVMEHGGQIEVASVVGQGTCFNVFLPLVPPARAAAAAGEKTATVP